MLRIEGQRSKQLHMKNIKHQNTQHKLQPIVSVTDCFFIIMKAPFLNSLSQQPFSAACLSSLSQWAASLSSLSQQPVAAAFRSSFSQQPFSAAFPSNLSEQLPFSAASFSSLLQQQPFSATVLSGQQPFSAAFLSNRSQRPAAFRHSLQPFSATFVSGLSQQRFAAAFRSSLSQLPFAAAFRSRLSQQPLSAAFLSSLSQHILSQHPFSHHHLAVVSGWWSAGWCHFAVATGWSSDCLGRCWKEPLISRKTCTLITHIAVGATLYLATMTTRDARAMKERERERGKEMNLIEFVFLRGCAGGHHRFQFV